jgi:hypothetical protein
MNAFEKVNSIVATILTNSSYKQVSPVMYDEELLNKKVSIMIFQENADGYLVRKFKVVVEDVTKEGSPNTTFSVTTEDIPMNPRYTS